MSILTRYQFAFGHLRHLFFSFAFFEYELCMKNEERKKDEKYTWILKFYVYIKVDL